MPETGSIPGVFYQDKALLTVVEHYAIACLHTSMRVVML